VVNLTTDVDPEAKVEGQNPQQEVLFEKLGTPVIKTYPTTLVRIGKGPFEINEGLKTTDHFLLDLADHGFEPAQELEEEFLISETGKSKEVIQSFMKLGIKDPDFIEHGDDLESAAKGVLTGSQPWLIMKHKDELEPHLANFDLLLQRSAKSTLTKFPAALLVYANVLRDRPWAKRKKYLKRARNKALKEQPMVILLNAEEIKEALPSYSNILKGAVKKLALTNPAGVLFMADKFVDEPWSETMILRAAKRDLPAGFAHGSRYRSHKDFDRIIKKIVKWALIRQPDLVIQYAELIEGQEWEADKIYQAATEEPEVFANNAERFKNKPYYDRLGQALTKWYLLLSADLAIQMLLKVFMDREWAKTYLEVLTKSRPEVTLIYKDLLMEQPWGQEIIDIGEKRLKELKAERKSQGKPLASSSIKKRNYINYSDSNSSIIKKFLLFFFTT